MYVRKRSSQSKSVNNINNDTNINVSSFIFDIKSFDVYISKELQINNIFLLDLEFFLHASFLILMLNY